MRQNFAISSPSIKVILLLCIGIYIIVFSAEIFQSISIHRVVDIANQKPGGNVIIDHVKYTSVYQINQLRIHYTVQNPMEYFLLNGGSHKQNLIGSILKLAIAVLGGFLLWKFDFTNPFKPAFFIQLYIIFRLVVIMFLMDYVAYRYSSYCMGSFLRGNNFHYVNATNGGYWFQIVIAVVIMYMYGNAVRNKEDLNLTI